MSRFTDEREWDGYHGMAAPGTFPKVARAELEAMMVNAVPPSPEQELLQKILKVLEDINTKMEKWA